MTTFFTDASLLAGYIFLMIFSGYLFGIGFVSAVKGFLRNHVRVIEHKIERDNGDGPDLPPGLKGYYQ